MLKSPAHLMTLDALLDVYPDANIVQTYRDSLEVIGSAASLHCTLRVGVVRRNRAARRGARPTRLLVASPGPCDRDQGRQRRPGEPVLRRAIRRPARRTRWDASRASTRTSGWNSTEEAQARMGKFMAENRREKHGVHRYRLEMFGIDAAEASDRFAGYCRRFDVKRRSGPADNEEIVARDRRALALGEDFVRAICGLRRPPVCLSIEQIFPSDWPNGAKPPCIQLNQDATGSNGAGGGRVSSRSSTAAVAAAQYHAERQVFRRMANQPDARVYRGRSGQGAVDRGRRPSFQADRHRHASWGCSESRWPTIRTATCAGRTGW